MIYFRYSFFSSIDNCSQHLKVFKGFMSCFIFFIIPLQKEGLICLDIVHEHSRTQHDVSTQGGEVPSNDFVDSTEQFTPEGVLYDKDQFVRWARDVYKNDGVVLVIRSSKDDKIYFRCERHGKSAKKKKNGQTSSKKCNCPFQIVGSKKKNGIWSLRKIDGSHNH
ncbi:uncharacterized protein LOC114271941 [Camellia sinensis]|uniref:uncharacterized protein LOC114271941 n=1 Tax=Camellia sinensis TaxID=4442 RepID=UPI001035F26A|nr:uncharacterized protein LOC114271941 [Camellia sinensis]